MKNFEPDFSRDAVFMPCSRMPFEFHGRIATSKVFMENIYSLAWWAANLCHLSYCPENKISELISDKGEELEFFREHSQFAYAVKIQGQIFLVFQGSCSREDAVLNMSFFPKRDEALAMHRGFSRAFSYLWPQIEVFVQKYKAENIIVAGHSLGGALAYIASTKFKCHSVYTFGAPRIIFGRLHNLPQNIYRFVNCSDVVTTLPPAIFGFKHIGQMYFIDEMQVIHENIGNRFLLKRMKSSGNYLLQGNSFSMRNAPLKSLVDHAPINYSRALSRHLLSSELEN